MSKHYRTENNCLNCGNDVNGKFCSNCGQENIEIKEPFWTFVSHGVGHYFHYDSKFKQTLKPFLTRPGQLTKDYMEGRRASHIPPISLYFFITLIYFICAPFFAAKNENDPTDEYQNTGKPGRLEKTKIPSQRDSEDSIYAEFKGYSYDLQLSEIAKLDSQLITDNTNSNRVSSDLLKRLKKQNIEAADSTLESYHRRQAGLSENAQDDLLERFWKEKSIKYKEETGHEFKIDDILDKYFSKLLFVLMPLFAFFLMLNFRRNKKLYMEHLIFTIHLFSFAYLTLFVSELLQYIAPSNVDSIIS